MTDICGPLNANASGPAHGRNSDFASHDLEKVRPAPGGEPAAREPGLGTGRGGDVTGIA